MHTRRSTAGFIFFLAGGPISWKSKKQPVVATSSTESEFMAVSGAAKEAIWLRHLLSDVGLVCGDSTHILEDNEACIRLCKAHIESQRTKHFDVQYKFTRERVMKTKEIDLVYCHTDDMIADALTKPLSRPKFEMFRDMMIMCKHHFANLYSVHTQ